MMKNSKEEEEKVEENWKIILEIDEQIPKLGVAGSNLINVNTDLQKIALMIADRMSGSCRDKFLDYFENYLLAGEKETEEEEERMLKEMGKTSRIKQSMTRLSDAVDFNAAGAQQSLDIVSAIAAALNEVEDCTDNGDFTPGISNGPVSVVTMQATIPPTEGTPSEPDQIERHVQLLERELKKLLAKRVTELSEKGYMGGK